MIELKGKYSEAKIFIDEVDETTYSQIVQIVNHPTFTNPVRVMPDTHAGASNSVIGFTMKLAESIIPNTVGVDIGCGMISAKIHKSVEGFKFEEVDKKIRKVIPIGNTNGIHKSPIISFEKQFKFEKAKDILWKFTKNFNNIYKTSFIPIDYNYNWFQKLCNTIKVDIGYVEQSLGSLGGGNHFIEIGQSSTDSSVWLTVHTGSRNFGKKVADYHTNIAKNLSSFDKKGFEKEFKKIKEQLKKQGKNSEIQNLRTQLRDKYSTQKTDVPVSMLYLKEQNMYDYFVDMIFAQIYASTNRKIIVENIVKILGLKVIESIESVHNYIDFEDFIIRKGAIRAYKGEKMIIPFNMADGILICEGKSNSDWNFSAPHGAGRGLSRTQAKQKLSFDEYKKIMDERNIFTTSVHNSTLDEAPMAYKSAEIIEKAIEPTAKVLFRLKPLYNLKAN
ncbi:MAG: RtcB family protein [Bacteroidales bacterium]|nr:RtcB family protein [Bacteroidales bacterium]